MSQRFEYKFERIGEGWTGVRKEAGQMYRQVIEQHAREGWRLVQIFSPGIGVYGCARYFEMIFEKPVG